MATSMRHFVAGGLLAIGTLGLGPLLSGCGGQPQEGTQIQPTPKEDLAEQEAAYSQPLPGMDQEQGPR